MKIEDPLEQTLCAKYCTYYKPGKNEALACRGYAVVERILQKKQSLLVDCHLREFEHATISLIVKSMCTACDFHEHDCDFMESRKARPCGGFVLLAQLLGSGEITLKDIR